MELNERSAGTVQLYPIMLTIKGAGHDFIYDDVPYILCIENAWRNLRGLSELYCLVETMSDLHMTALFTKQP